MCVTGMRECETHTGRHVQYLCTLEYIQWQERLLPICLVHQGRPHGRGDIQCGILIPEVGRGRGPEEAEAVLGAVVSRPSVGRLVRAGPSGPGPRRLDYF